jgi:hypothetical protein
VGLSSSQASRLKCAERQEVDEMLKPTSPPDSFEAFMSRAFYREPRIAYVLPDEAARPDVLPLFFRSVLIPAAQTCGEIYTSLNGCALSGLHSLRSSPRMEGCSLWISPGRFLASIRMVRSRMHALLPNLEPSSWMRWANLSANMEEIHRRLAKGHHWYLLGFGIEPSRPHDRSELKPDGAAQPSIEDVSGVLIDPVLSRADRDRQVCYVENFDETRLSFYEDRGFRIAGAGRVPGGGPNFWAMIRRPPSRFGYQQNTLRTDSGAPGRCGCLGGLLYRHQNETKNL